jgi:hypothetical protein
LAYYIYNIYKKMNNWKESDFQKNEFHDSTEFFDMLHIIVESIAIPPP